jgi:hypothetical protein
MREGKMVVEIEDIQNTSESYIFDIATAREH